MVNVTLAVPTITVAGEMPEITGTEFPVIAKATAFETPLAPEGFTTVTCTVELAVTSAAAISAVS
jgi:hypothetical protein